MRNGWWQYMLYNYRTCFDSSLQLRSTWSLLEDRSISLFQHRRQPHQGKNNKQFLLLLHITSVISIFQNPVAHCWSEIFPHKRKFCNVCRKRLDDSESIHCESKCSLKPREFIIISIVFQYASTMCTPNAKILPWPTAKKTLLICRESACRSYTMNTTGERATFPAIPNVLSARRPAGRLNVSLDTDANGVGSR